ncbi:MAG: metal-dependent hydrolase [Actinomycetota bacterium]|nr:metal-dependent hydrolase [Actinomycetota bacterium]
MRTYSHAVLTWTAVRFADPSEASVAAWGASGATLPDLPAIVGAVWLGSRRRRLDRSEFREVVCARRSFAGPDAALHSALPVGALSLIFWTLGSSERSLRKPLFGFLIGWAGHVLADALTHAEDARPILWPISEQRFRSPLSYWDRSHHARAFTMVEHGTLLLLVAWTISRRIRAPRPPDPPSG